MSQYFCFNNVPLLNFWSGSVPGVAVIRIHFSLCLLLCLIDPCMQASTCLFDRMEYRDQHCSTVPPIRERHAGAPRSTEQVTGNREPACNSQHTSAYRSTGSVAASACLSRRFCTEFRHLVFYFYPNFSYMFVVFNLDSLFLDFSYYQFFLCELFGLTYRQITITIDDLDLSYFFQLI